MASRSAVIGTTVALAGFAGLGVAAIGAADSTTPLQPAADTVATQTQTTQTQAVRTVEDRVTRAASHKRRHRDHNRARAARDSSGPGPAGQTQTHTQTSPQSDDGPTHDLRDDRGGRGEVEPGDDHGGGRETEAGDDRGGDDRSGRGRGQDD